MFDDLNGIHDDIEAFTAGLGLHCFPGFVSDAVPSILWESEDTLESWKDFLELARNSEVPFVTMSSAELEGEELEELVVSFERAGFEHAEELEEARQLRGCLRRLGFIQLGFPCQGVMFVCELTTSWYDNFRQLQEAVGEINNPLPGEAGAEEDEH